MEVVSIEVARKEVEKWLDFKKVKQAKRDAHAGSIDFLAYAISVGDITIDDKLVIKQKLSLPVDGLYSELEYKPRLSIEELHKHMGAMNVRSTDDAVVCVAAALTGKSVSQIKKMDTEDYVIPAGIGVFFI